MNQDPSTREHPLAVLRRRKWAVLLTLIAVVLLTEAATKVLTRVYDTTASLLVSQPGTVQTFDIAQANEELARSYAQIFASPRYAQQVASALGGGATSAGVQSAVSISAVPSTELIDVSAESPDPARAQRIANTYASVVVKDAPALSPNGKVDVSLASAAPLPTSPSRPKPLLYGVVAALVGLALGIALAFLRERFDLRLRSVEEIAAHLRLPILADIPLRGSNPRSIGQFVEAMRLLRTNLQFMSSSARWRSLAVTSWEQGEGKTTVAAQLATMIADSGSDTLAIDGDTIRPELHRLLSNDLLDSHQSGLTDYLTGAAVLEESLRPTRSESLSLLPAGHTGPSVAALLSSRGGSESFGELLQRSEVVVIDCPPLAVGADAPAIAARADAVILVVDLARATKPNLTAAVRRLQGVGAHIIGLAVNRDRDRGRAGYYGYYRQPNGRRSLRLTRRARARIAP
jgi:capsular exopolysaccharide synthesis family protein